MMSGRKGDAYLGGHTVYHMHPVGERDRNEKQSKNNGKSWSKFYHEVENAQIRIAKEKLALRKIIISSEDEILLGVKSSGWATYRKAVQMHIKNCKKANIRGADMIAAALNRFGFKTGSGARWTPRLVKIFIQKFGGGGPRLRAKSNKRKTIAKKRIFVEGSP
jgi:hypothetical protein